MATLTLLLPDQMKDWIEEEVRRGDYVTTSDFVQELVRKERERREPTMTVEELRKTLAEASAAGPGHRTIEDVLAEGDRVLRERGALRD